MKKIIPTLALSAICFTLLLVMAQGCSSAEDGSGSGGEYGFTGGGNIELSKLGDLARDDKSYVYLEGYIKQYISGSRGKQYLFTDGTGNAILELYVDSVWRGLTVSPDDKVGIWAEIGTGSRNTDIRVFRIIKK